MSTQEEYKREKAKLEDYCRHLEELENLRFDAFPYPYFHKVVEDQKRKVEELRKKKKKEDE